MEKVARANPKLQFALIDAVVTLPNVQSILFKEHEGSFLVGMLAAMASKTGKVGFIGGMDIPLIRKFGCGYAQGVKAVNPDATIILNMTGTTPAAWNDPVKGAELAKGQKAQGADVIYAAAGGTGVGVLQAAADEGILSIGVDSNQNYMHPGKVLTSMLKRVDNAVYEAFKEGENLTAGINVMGLANDGVGYAMDENNASLVSAEMQAAVDEAAAVALAPDGEDAGHSGHGGEVAEREGLGGIEEVGPELRDIDMVAIALEDGEVRRTAGAHDEARAELRRANPQRPQLGRIGRFSHPGPP